MPHGDNPSQCNRVITSVPLPAPSSLLWASALLTLNIAHEGHFRTGVPCIVATYTLLPGPLYAFILRCADLLFSILILLFSLDTLPVSPGTTLFPLDIDLDKLKIILMPNIMFGIFWGGETHSPSSHRQLLNCFRVFWQAWILILLI